MPRVKRRGHLLRQEKPISEMSDVELAEARAIYERDSRLGSPNAIRGLQYLFRVEHEQARRFQTEASGKPMTDARLRQWAAWRGYPLTDPYPAAGVELLAVHARQHLYTATERRGNVSMIVLEKEKGI